MNAIVFAGPTIERSETGIEFDEDWRGPAAQGDVYLAALERPAAIGIIDGYFESIPAVWHKEILWAMSQGIHVFGSASIGALRAAELEHFGMRGVGAIFEAYRDGSIEDDDEVAVAHASAEHGFRPGSDAMVNIRATVRRAKDSAIIGDAVAQLLVEIAKALFYPQRSFATILDLAAANGVSSTECARFRAWLPSGRVDQKRIDALAMLHAMRDFLAGGPQPMQVSYVFEESCYWEAMRGNSHAVLREADALVLRELRRDPVRWARANEGALGWWLAERLAWRDGHAAEAGDVVRSSAEFCAARGISSAEGVDAWLARNRSSRDRLDKLLMTSAQASYAIALAGPEMEAILALYLLWSGDYEQLLAGASVSLP
jgi:hypothetical protein